MARKTKAPDQPVARSGTALARADSPLLDDIRRLIGQAREATARAVNSALVILHWQVGHRIRAEVLEAKRADYGEQVVATLSGQLSAEFGGGYSKQNLFRMLQFADAFPEPAIVATLSRQLGWSHFVELLPLKEPLKRDFYAEMCRVERWSVRTLREKVASMLFERTALSKKPEALARQELARLRAEGVLTPDLVFRDPYFLDFLGLKDTYSEADLEAAILRENERFILELGAGFAFVARQKRIVIDGEDFRIDLLFHHRKLRRLVAVDLKLGKFQAADKGQMELYLRWLEEHEMEEGEESPLGLILCAGKGDEQVELLQLDKSGIRVASYLTELPPKAVLRERLHAAAELVRGDAARRTIEAGRRTPVGPRWLHGMTSARRAATGDRRRSFLTPRLRRVGVRTVLSAMPPTPTFQAEQPLCGGCEFPHRLSWS